jgi:hypothetical protein
VSSLSPLRSRITFVLILGIRNLAFGDSEWKTINQRVDTFYTVEGVPEPIRNAFMPSLMPNGDPADRPWGYARAEHLLELRDFVKKHPLTPANRIVEWAKALQLKEAEIIRLSEEKERKKRRRTKEEGGGEASHPAGEPPGEIVNVPKKEIETPSSEKSVLVIPRRTVEGFSTDDLLRSSPVAESKIIRSTSSKLNRVLAEVCWPCPFIIIQP